MTDPESRQLRYSPTKIREIGSAAEPILGAFRGLVGGTLPWPLFLHGQPGSGKTCAALALLDHAITGAYATCTELVERTHKGYNGGVGIRWDEHFGPARRALVVLDELGTRKTITDTHYEVVQKMLDLREHYPLIVISNLNIEEVGALYDERIASRCAAGTVVELKGRDRRID
jgi:DNA replication protein DnaC